MDVNASRTISGVGVAAAGTAKDLQVLSTGTLKFVGAAGAAGIASVGLAGALGVGLGGAFAAAGVGVALLNKNVQDTFKNLGTNLKSQLASVSKPVQTAMLDLAKYIKTAFTTMKPLFAGFFQAVAPLITIIGQGLVGAVANLVGEFTPLIKVVTPIVRELFNQLPDLIGNIAYALNEILSPLSSNTKAFGTLLQTIGSLLPIVGSIIGSLVRLGAQIMPTFQRAILGVGTALDSGLMKVLPLVGKAIQTMLPPIARLAAALLPALGAILRALLPVLSSVVAALAGALARVLPQLVPAFVGLIQVVGQLLKGLQPLLPSLVYLAVWIGKVANNLLSAILPVVVALLSGLLPALKVILPIIIQVANQVGNALAEAFKQAVPSLVLLAKAVGQILIALTPLIPVVVAAALSFLPLIPAAARIASVLAQGLVPIVLALTPLLVFLAPTLVKLAVAAKLWAVAQGILNVVLAANPIGLVIIAVAALAAGLVYAWKHSETFRDVVKGAFNAIKVAIGAVITFIITAFRGWFDTATTVVLGILRLFGKLPGPLGAPFRAAEDAVRKAKGTVDTQLDKIQKRVNQLTGKDIPITARTSVEVSKSVRQYLAASNVPGFHARGTLIPGYGGGDIYPAYLEPGEAVVPKDKAARPDFRAWARFMGIPGFQLGGLVTSYYNPTVRQTGRIGQSMADVAAAVLGQLSSLAFGGGAASGNVINLALAMAKRMAASFKVALALIEAGIVESGLQNLPYGDRDSLGFLQQRPSQGWLHPMNISYAAWDFLRRAIPIQGRYGTAGMLAQAVQRSAFPGRYDAVQASALGILHGYGYDRGGFLPPGLSLAYNGTGRPERVGGGNTFMFNITAVGTDRSAARQLLQSIREDLRSRGKTAIANQL